MKKTTALKVSALVCLLTSSGKIYGSDITLGDLNFTINESDKTAICDGAASSDTRIVNLVIPDEITYRGNAYPVTAIANNAFFRNNNIEGTVTLSANLETIGEYAFYAANYISGTLNIGNKVRTIGEYAFTDCDGITSLYLGADSELGSPVLEVIGEGAFADNQGLTGGLIFPNSLKYIGQQAFTDCVNLTGSLNIPDEVVTIENGAFYNCPGFTSLTLGNSLKSIGDYAFSQCTGFSNNLVLPATLESIGDTAFYQCYYFTGSLIIPDSVTSIGNMAFYSCFSFTGNLTIGNGVTIIGERAFYGCNSFSGNLILGNNVQTISSEAFAYCRAFTGSLVIPNSVTSIGYSAFRECSGFDSLILGDNLQTIGDLAFITCFGFLGDLVIPNSVVSIGESAFSGCKGFSGSLIIGDSVTTIYSAAFSECNGFRHLVLGRSLSSIGKGDVAGISFYGPDFETVTSHATIPPSCESLNFSSDTYSNAILTVPEGTVEAYKSAPDWENFYKITSGDEPISISIAMEQNPLVILQGETLDIIVNIVPETVAESTILTWTSSDPEIATITQFGRVEGISPGVSTITVSTENGLSDSIQVFVEEITATSLTLNENAVTIQAYDTFQLIATVEPENTSYPEIYWTTADNRIATVSQDGLVTGLYQGTTTITAQCQGLLASCQITVTPLEISSFTLNTNRLELSPGSEGYLWIDSYYPDNATDFATTWSSSNNAVAEVNDNGMVKAISLGQAVITALCGNATATCEVYVTNENFGDDPEYKLPTPEDISIKGYNSYNDGDVIKIRENNLLTLSVSEAQGGYPDSWVYIWSIDYSDIADSRISTYPALIPWGGEEPEIFTANCHVTVMNFNPQGYEWVFERIESPQDISIYRRPNLPSQLLKKGNGQSNTLIVMDYKDENDSYGVSHTYVYGFTDPNRNMTEITRTDLRYCHVDPAIYNDSSYRLWVYKVWTYEDGSEVTSGLLYLDGEIDEEFDASVYSNSSRSIEGDNSFTASLEGILTDLEDNAEGEITVTTINGITVLRHQIRADEKYNLQNDLFTPGIYIMTVTIGDKINTKKIAVR